MRWFSVLLAKYKLRRAKRDQATTEFVDALSKCLQQLVPGAQFRLQLVVDPSQPLTLSIECVSDNPRLLFAWSELQDALELGGLGSSSGPSLR